MVRASSTNGVYNPWRWVALLLLSFASVFAADCPPSSVPKFLEELLNGKQSIPEIRWTELSKSEQEFLRSNLKHSAQIQVPNYTQYGSLKTPGLSSTQRVWKLKHPQGDQIVDLPTDIEKEIVTRLKANPTSKEMFTVIATRNKETIHFGKFHGGKGEITEEALAQGVNEFFRDYHAKFRANDMDHIEIILSQPHYDAAGSGTSVTHPLTRSQLALGAAYSRQLRLPVVIKSAAPNGYTYGAGFYEGQNVTFDLHGIAGP